MRFLVVSQTSKRRFFAHILGTRIWSQGTSLQFAVGQMMVDHGHRFDVNVMPESEAYVRSHWMGFCAVPIQEEE